MFNMKERLMSVFTIGGLLVIIVAMCAYIGGIDERKAQNVTTSPAPAENVQTVSTTVAASVSVTAPAVTTTLPPVTEGTTAPATSAAAETTALVTEAQEKAMPESTKEIIDKYTQLVNNFKEKKPAYKKKEFQALPVLYTDVDPCHRQHLGRFPSAVFRSVHVVCGRFHGPDRFHRRNDGFSIAVR